MCFFLMRSTEALLPRLLLGCIFFLPTLRRSGLGLSSDGWPILHPGTKQMHAGSHVCALISKHNLEQRKQWPCASEISPSRVL